MSAPDPLVECDGRCLVGVDVGLHTTDVVQPDPLCTLHGTITPRERDLIMLASLLTHERALHVGACRVEHCTSPHHVHGTIGQLVNDVLDEVGFADQAGEVDVKLGEFTRDPDEGLNAADGWGDL